MARNRDFFAHLASAVTRFSGSSLGFGSALGVIIIWAASGPIFHWSDTWQLVINTGTTIVTFLMVFLIQRTQNKDGLAIQLKLNELVSAIEHANNRLIDVEDLSDSEMKVLHQYYQRLAAMAAEELKLDETHSLDEAKLRHSAKRRHRQRDAG